MRQCSLILCALVAGCGPVQSTPTASSGAVIAALRDTLIRMGAADQSGRDSIGIVMAMQDTLFMKRMSRDDSARTRWLQKDVTDHGWPRRSVVGDTAAEAAWLIVQHSPLYTFQEQMLPLLTAEAKQGELNAADVAMLEDRVQVHRGSPQRYGTQFAVSGGKLVADPITDQVALDSLRQSVGLPPMTEYVRQLAKLYHMPVEWPPSKGK